MIKWNYCYQKEMTFQNFLLGFSNIVLQLTRWDDCPTQPYNNRVLSRGDQTVCFSWIQENHAHGSLRSIVKTSVDPARDTSNQNEQRTNILK